MKHTVILCLLVISVSALAEQYRLKFAATVDVIEDGNVTGQKRLKAGTVLELAETASSEVEAASDGSKKMSSKFGKKVKLVASDMSPVIWKNKRPPHNVFRAEIELTDSYYYSWRDKKNTHWCVNISTRNADWGYVNEGWLTGYVLKSSSVGKRIEAALKDGKEHRALVQVKPTKFKDETSLCVIEEFELVSGD